MFRVVSNNVNGFIEDVYAVRRNGEIAQGVKPFFYFT